MNIIANHKHFGESPNKICPLEWGIFYLALLFLYFVATKILLRLGKDHVFAQNWIILAKAELVWRIHGVFLGIVKANT